jgi:hypothetical protein
LTYAAGDLLDEVAYVAAGFHWSLAEILDLEHPDRRRFLAVAQKINEQAGELDQGR